MPIALPGAFATSQRDIKVPGVITLTQITTELTGAGVSTFEADLPAGMVEGDKLVIVCGATYPGNAAGTILSPDGMTLAKEQNHQRVNGSGNVSLWWVDYLDSMGSTMQFTSGQLRNWSSFAMVIDGLGSSPVDEVGGAVDTNQPLDLPDLTPGVMPTLGIEAFCARSNSFDQTVITSYPTGTTEIYNARNTSSSDADADHRLYVGWANWFDTDPTGIRAYGLTDLATGSTQYCAGLHVLLD